MWLRGNLERGVYHAMMPWISWRELCGIEVVANGLFTIVEPRVAESDG